MTWKKSQPDKIDEATKYDLPPHWFQKGGRNKGRIRKIVNEWLKGATRVQVTELVQEGRIIRIALEDVSKRVGK